MSTSNSMRRSTRICRAPVRFNPCITKPCCSHDEKHTEKKEPLPPPALPELNLTDTCCICMEDVDTKNNRVTTECGHTFCSSCLFRHLEENHQCPLCRFALRRPVKKTPTLSPPVAESLITGLGNSSEEQQGIEAIAREMYIQVIEDLGTSAHANHPPIDREAVWARASTTIRARMLQLMRGYQIMWGMNVCREISQWMQYVSTNPIGLPNLTSFNLERQVNQLRENITNVDEFIDNNGEEDDNDYVSDADTELNEAAIGLEVDNINDLSDYINDEEDEMDSDSDMPELEDIPIPELEPIPPIPLESTPAELSSSDIDVFNYIFEFNRNEPILNHIEGQIINSIGIDRIISDAMNMVNNVNHYRQTRR